jgi:hypothetical protein
MGNFWLLGILLQQHIGGKVTVWGAEGTPVSSRSNQVQRGQAAWQPPNSALPWGSRSSVMVAGVLPRDSIESLLLAIIR